MYLQFSVAIHQSHAGAVITTVLKTLETLNQDVISSV